MTYPCAILPPPRTVPVVVVLATWIGKRQDELKISGRPSAAQSKISILLATDSGRVMRGRVAVTPKLPAVPVVAESVTVFTSRMYLPESAAGMKPLSGCMNEARRVAASDMPVRLALVPSLYVTLTVAVTAVEPVSVYHSNHHWMSE